MIKSIVTLLFAAGVAFWSAEIVAQSGVHAQGEHASPEPDLKVRFSPEPPYSRRHEGTSAEIGVIYGRDVPTGTPPDLIFDPLLLDVSFVSTDFTKLKISALTSTAGTETVAYVTLKVQGVNGRSNSQKFPVYINAGALVGEIKPDSLTDKFKTGTHQIGDVSYFGNRFEGSVFFIDKNADGTRSDNEPSTVVDARNRFRFPDRLGFYRELLIRPKALWVDGTSISDSGFNNHLVDEAAPWFLISDPVNEPARNLTRKRLPIGPTPANPSPADPPPMAPVVPAAIADDAADGAREADANQADKALRVKADSQAAMPDGKTWATAFPKLEAALVATAGGERKSLWIAQGVYRQAVLPTGQPAGFQIPNGVSLYGGFLGVDAEKRIEDRPRIRRASTILTGDVDENDGHFGRVTAVAATPDGDLVVTAGADCNLKIWKKVGPSYSLQRTLFGHTQAVNDVAITSDGKLVVSGGDDMTIRLWKIDSVPLNRIVVPESVTGPVGAVLSVCFSPQHGQFAAASADGVIRGWTTAGTMPNNQWKGHVGEVFCVVFVADGVLASGGADGTIRIWDNSSANAVQVLEGHAGPVTSLAVIPGLDDAFISAGEDSSIRIWRRPKPTEPFQPSLSFSGEDYELKLPTISAETDLPQNGLKLATLAKFNDKLLLRVFDGRGERIIDETLEGDNATRLSAAVGARWNTPQLSPVDRATIIEVLSPLIGDRPLRDDFGPVNDVAIAADGRTVVASHAAKYQPAMENTLSFWSAETGQLIFAKRVKVDDFTAAIVAPPRDPAVPNLGSQIIGGREDGGIAVAAWTPVNRQVSDHGMVTSAAISDDGKVTASGGDDGKIFIRNQDGSVPIAIDLTMTQGGAVPVKSLVFNHSASQLAFAAGKHLFAPPPQASPDLSKTALHDGNVTCIAFSDDGKRIATGDDAGVVYVWKHDDFSNVRKFAGHLGPVTCIDIVGTDDACRILSGSADRTVRVWDLANGTLDDTIGYDAPISGCTATGVPSDIRTVVSVEPVEFQSASLATNIPITLSGHQPIDGRTTVDGDRILVVAQTNPTENGIYDAAAGVWRRSVDADEVDEFVSGKTISLREGPFAKRHFMYAGAGRAAPGTDVIVFIADFKPTVEVLHWKKELGVPPQRSRIANLSTVDVMKRVAMAADGRTVVGSGSGGVLRIWRANALGELGLSQSVKAHGATPTAIGVTNDGRHILSAGGDHLIVWSDSAPVSLAAAPFSPSSPSVTAQDKNASSVVVVVDDAAVPPIQVILDGLTIQGGVQKTGSGAGLLVNNHKEVVVRDCIVEGNTAVHGAGARVTKEGNVHFERTLFAWNAAKTSGGGASAAGTATFDSCVFHENRAVTKGGGVEVETDGTVSLLRSTIHGCWADSGSAIHSTMGNKLRITSSTITNNRAKKADGFALESADETGVTLRNSIVAVNLRDDGTHADVKCALTTDAATNLFGSARDIFNEEAVFVAPADAPQSKPWQAFKNADGKLNYRHSAGEPLSSSELFDGFGDFGGFHPTVGLATVSFARERGGHEDSLRLDQRGRRYLGTYVLPDIGAFEWQPLPAAQSEEFVLRDPDLPIDIDVVENDGSPKLSAASVVAEGSLSASFGTLTTGATGLSYKLKDEFNDEFKHWLGRDEVRYLAEFGGRTSEPGRASVWIVGKSAESQTFVVTTEHDQEISETGSIDFREGGLTLREAMILASYSEGNDEIRFQPEVFASARQIKLVAPLRFGPQARGELKIIGPGAERLTLVGPGTTVDGGSPPFRALEITSSKAGAPLVTISHLTFSNFAAPAVQQGGAIWIAGDSEVRLDYVGFVNNTATDGSAVFIGSTGGAVNLTQCTLRDNRSSAADGLTVRSAGKAAVVTESVFWKNLFNFNSNPERHDYGSTNFVTDPRFMSSDVGEIRLRRDSLAFRPSNGAASSKPAPKGAYSPRYRSDGGRISTHEADYSTGVSIGADVVHVDHSAASGGDGTSRATAYRTLDDGLERAAVDYSIAEVRIAGGVDSIHTPGLGYELPRTAAGLLNTFIVQHGLGIAGGYPSTTARDATGNSPPGDISDPASYPTTVQGLLSGGGETPLHCETVLTARGTHSFQVANLTIRGGFAKEKREGHEPGGGAFRGSHACDGRLTGLTLVENEAFDGGAIYLAEGTLQVDGCLFQKNKAVAVAATGGRGGAVYLAHLLSTLAIKHCSFTENSAGDLGGAALHLTNGKLTADFLTIVENQAGTNGGGIWIETGIHPITNCILARNTPKDVVGPNLSADNVVAPTWNPLLSLLAKPDFNEYQPLQAGGGFQQVLRQGPTRSIAVLPQIPFRRDSSEDTLVDQADTTSTEQDDQLGPQRRPSPAGGRNDFGAFERQYFKGTSDFPRFFVVDDSVTGRHLWAETALNQYVQVSQHRQADTDRRAKLSPIIMKVAEDSVEFATDGRSYAATRNTTGFVKPLTSFPSETDSVLKIAYKAKPRIKLELDNDGTVDRLTVSVPSGDAAPERWRITLPSARVIESTAPTFVVSPIGEATYTVEMIRGSEQEKITVRIDKL